MFGHYTNMLVLLVTALSAVTMTAQRTVVIRNPHAGLVLDATQFEVKLEYYSGSASQLWIIEQAELGKHFIVNKRTGNVLHINGGKGADIVTFRKHGGATQQWYINSDKTIVSASNFAVDLYGQKYTPGTKVIAYPKHGKKNQQFYFQYNV